MTRSYKEHQGKILFAVVLLVALGIFLAPFSVIDGQLTETVTAVGHTWDVSRPDTTTQVTPRCAVLGTRTSTNTLLDLSYRLSCTGSGRAQGGRSISAKLTSVDLNDPLLERVVIRRSAEANGLGEYLNNYASSTVSIDDRVITTKMELRDAPVQVQTGDVIITKVNGVVTVDATEGRLVFLPEKPTFVTLSVSSFGELPPSNGLLRVTDVVVTKKTVSPPIVTPTVPTTTTGNVTTPTTTTPNTTRPMGTWEKLPSEVIDLSTTATENVQSWWERLVAWVQSWFT